MSLAITLMVDSEIPEELIQEILSDVNFVGPEAEGVNEMSVVAGSYSMLQSSFEFTWMEPGKGIIEGFKAELNKFLMLFAQMVSGKSIFTFYLKDHAYGTYPLLSDKLIIETDATDTHITFRLRFFVLD